LEVVAGFLAAGVDLAEVFFTMGFGAFFALAALTGGLGAAALGLTLDLTGAAGFALGAGLAGLVFEGDLAAALGAGLADGAGFLGEFLDLPVLAITLGLAFDGGALAPLGAGLAGDFLAVTFLAGAGADLAAGFLPVVLGFAGINFDG
jgi:hypothetical protein